MNQVIEYKKRAAGLLTILCATSFCIALPLIAAAQSPSLRWFESLIMQADNIIRVVLVPLTIGLSVVLFVWGVIKYFIYGAADESARSTGRIYMLYALIGLTAIVAVWGFVNLIIQMLGIGIHAAPTINNYLP